MWCKLGVAHSSLNDKKIHKINNDKDCQDLRLAFFVVHVPTIYKYIIKN